MSNKKTKFPKVKTRLGRTTKVDGHGQRGKVHKTLKRLSGCEIEQDFDKQS